MMWVDHQILLFAATHRTEGLDIFFRGVTWLGSLYVLGPLTLLIAGGLFYWGKQTDAWFLVVGLGGATVLVHIVKLVLARPRPAIGERLVPLPWDSSFPSSHTMQIAAFSLCVVLIICRLWPHWWLTAAALAVLLVLLVGVSRIYLQVHYPTDVLAGIVLACAWVALAHKVF